MPLSRGAEQNRSWKAVEDLPPVFFHIFALEDKGETGSLVDMHWGNRTRSVAGLRHDEAPEVPHLPQLTEVRSRRQRGLTRLSVFMHRRFVGVGYLLMMAVANVCYFAGPLSESLIKPTDVDRYRRVTFQLGLWFSVLLPFTIPVIVAWSYLVHPSTAIAR